MTSNNNTKDKIKNDVTVFFNESNYMKNLTFQKDRIDGFIEIYPEVVSKIKEVISNFNKEIFNEESIEGNFFEVAKPNDCYNHIIKSSTEGNEHHNLRLYATKFFQKKGYNIYFELPLNLKKVEYVDFSELKYVLTQEVLKNYVIYTKKYRIVERFLNKVFKIFDKYENEREKNYKYVVDIFCQGIYEGLTNYIIIECDNKNINYKWQDFYNCFKTLYKDKEIEFYQISSKKVKVPWYVKNLVMKNE